MSTNDVTRHGDQDHRPNDTTSSPGTQARVLRSCTADVDTLLAHASAALMSKARDVQDLQNELQAVRKQCSHQDAVIAALHQELSAAKAASRSTTARLEIMQTGAAAFQQRAVNAERDLATRGDELAVILSSRSWIWTAWWRALCRIMSRLLFARSFRRRFGRHFDARFYLDQNADVRYGELDPLVHYVRYGAVAGRDPNAGFSSGWYLRRYPDVAAANINPLAHYLSSGRAEGRDPHPDVSHDVYDERYGR